MLPKASNPDASSDPKKQSSTPFVGTCSILFYCFCVFTIFSNSRIYNWIAVWIFAHAKRNMRD